MTLQLLTDWAAWPESCQPARPGRHLDHALVGDGCWCEPVEKIKGWGGNDDFDKVENDVFDNVDFLTSSNLYNVDFYKVGF